MENLTPVILFVYNRPEHTKQTVEYLSKNRLAESSNLYIFSDGPKNEKDKQKVSEVREFIKSIKGFQEIIIIEREKNFGLADSIISGVTKIINQYEKVIVLEDDIVTSPFFLTFMNEALEFYQKDDSIFTISGYNYPVHIPKDYPFQVYLSPRSSSWGWGTWKDRWEKVDWKPNKELLLNNKKSLNSLLDKAGKDLAPMLLKSIEGKINSWAVRAAFTQAKRNSYTIFPIKSLAKNVGTDASGTNFIRKTRKYDVELEVEKMKFEFTPNLNPNYEIVSQIIRLVRPGILSFIKYRLFSIY